MQNLLDLFFRSAKHLNSQLLRRRKVAQGNEVKGVRGNMHIYISLSLSFPFYLPPCQFISVVSYIPFPFLFFSAYIISFVCFFLFFFLSFSCSYACFIFFISLPFQFVLYPFIYVSLCECVCLKHFRVPQTAVGARKLQELRRAMKDRKIN